MSLDHHLFQLHRYVSNLNRLKLFAKIQRADGTWRKARTVKEGYVPPEDIGKFVCSAEQRHRAAAQYVPGTSRLRNPNAGKLSSIEFYSESWFDIASTCF